MGKSLKIKNSQFVGYVDFSASLLGELAKNVDFQKAYGKEGQGNTIYKTTNTKRCCTHASIGDLMEFCSALVITAKTGYKFVPMVCDNDIKHIDTSIAFDWYTSKTITLSSITDARYKNIALNLAKSDDSVVETDNVSTYIEVNAVLR